MLCRAINVQFDDPYHYSGSCELYAVALGALTIVLIFDSYQNLDLLAFVIMKANSSIPLTLFSCILLYISYSGVLCSQESSSCSYKSLANN